MYLLSTSNIKVIIVIKVFSHIIVAYFHDFDFILVIWHIFNFIHFKCIKIHALLIYVLVFITWFYGHSLPPGINLVHTMWTLNNEYTSVSMNKWEFNSLKVFITPISTTTICVDIIYMVVPSSVVLNTLGNVIIKTVAFYNDVCFFNFCACSR